MELSIECLSKRFGSKIAVNNISVTLQPGVYGLLGANGAGKTTLMRMVCDVLKPTSGRILYNGKEIEQLGEHYRSYLGYLPQDFGYYPDFTAKEYLDFIVAIKGIDTVTAKKKIAELLEIVNLSDVAGKKIRTFSGRNESSDWALHRQLSMIPIFLFWTNPQQDLIQKSE